jgi:hypothetical protein
VRVQVPPTAFIKTLRVFSRSFAVLKDFLNRIIIFGILEFSPCLLYNQFINAAQNARIQEVVMGEIFSEWIIKRKTPQKVRMIEVLLVIVCVLSCALISIPYVGVLVVALIIFLTYIYFKNNDVEWEYALVEKNMYIDKIMKKSKRKRMGEYDLTKTEVMAPADSSYIKEYDNRNLKVCDYSSLIPENENKKYVMVILNNNELVKLILEPDERMLKELRDIIPRQLHID